MHLPSPEAVWTSVFDKLCQRIEHCSIRQETRHRVQRYLQGLLSPVERKNGWQLAEEIGEPNPYEVQYLLDRAKWDEDAMRDERRAYGSFLARLAPPYVARLFMINL